MKLEQIAEKATTAIKASNFEGSVTSLVSLVRDELSKHFNGSNKINVVARGTNCEIRSGEGTHAIFKVAKTLVSGSAVFQRFALKEIILSPDSQHTTLEDVVGAANAYETGREKTNNDIISELLCCTIPMSHVIMYHKKLGSLDRDFREKFEQDMIAGGKW